MLDSALVKQIREQYASRRRDGRRIWSLARLADAYGVSETSIFRIVHGIGRYADPDIQAAQERLAARLRGEPNE
jgi:hypothetical protein